MGTFGLGGLHRKSTWLYPVATYSALPPTAVDGSVAVLLDTNVPYEYDAALPGWIPLSGGGGGGTSNIFHWPVGMSWATVYADILANGGYGIVAVDADIIPRLMTAAPLAAETDLTHIVFVGHAIDSANVAIDFQDGFKLKDGVLRSQNILWRSLATATPIVAGGVGNLNFLFDGGGFTAWTDPSAVYPIIMTPGFNRIVLENEATFDGSGFTTPGTTLVRMASSAVADLIVLTGSVVGGYAFSESSGGTVNADLDAESRITTGAAQPFVTLNINLLDRASLVFYDDTLVAPLLGAGNVQDAIDALKSAVATELREVVLSFSALVTPGTAINIQTGVYVGAGSPATVDYDTNVTLPASGAAFRDDGKIEILLNGQGLTKGDGSGNGEAEWVSSTQIKLNIKIKNFGQVTVRAPYPTA